MAGKIFNKRNKVEKDTINIFKSFKIQSFNLKYFFEPHSYRPLFKLTNGT